MHSAIASQLIDSAHATQAELQEISAAWLAWVADDDGWISIPHGELLYRVP